MNAMYRYWTVDGSYPRMYLSYAHIAPSQAAIFLFRGRLVVRDVSFLLSARLGMHALMGNRYLKYRKMACRAEAIAPELR